MRPRLSPRVLLVALIAAIAAVAVRVAAPETERHIRVSAAACGVGRWKIKTLQDRPRLLRPRRTTIAHLSGVPRPALLPPARRVPFERHVFTVVAAVTLVRHEDDQDLQLVLFEPWDQLQGQSRPDHLIAEAPSRACTIRATPYRRRQMQNSRRAVSLCARARVVGVAFFDHLRGQTGVAPNGIKLHPVLGFACLSG
jgi:hypothetical protein